jgi:hypothetical protein
MEITFELSLRDVYRSNVAIMTGNLKWFFWPFALISLVTIAAFAFSLVARATGSAMPNGFAGLWGILVVPTLLIYDIVRRQVARAELRG